MIKDCRQKNEPLASQITTLKELLKKASHGEWTKVDKYGHFPTYKGYDAWSETFDHKKEYESTYNWLLIASAGDPTTWDGAQVTIKKGKSDKGLAGSIYDIAGWQERLYQRPTGRDSWTNWTHRL